MKDYVCEYTYVPECDKIKSGVLVSGCIAAAMGMLGVSEIDFFLSPYFKAGAAVWVLVGALFAVRLLTTGYAYSIFRDETSGARDLVINEIRFGSSKTVCRVSLFDIREFSEYDASQRVPSKRGKKGKRPKRPRAKGRCYNYCVDVIPARFCIVRIAGSRAECIKFSPDEIMINYIKSMHIK